MDMLKERTKRISPLEVQSTVSKNVKVSFLSRVQNSKKKIKRSYSSRPDHRHLSELDQSWQLFSSLM